MTTISTDCPIIGQGTDPGGLQTAWFLYRTADSRHEFGVVEKGNTRKEERLSGIQQHGAGKTAANQRCKKAASAWFKIEGSYYNPYSLILFKSVCRETPSFLAVRLLLFPIVLRVDLITSRSMSRNVNPSSTCGLFMP